MSFADALTITFIATGADQAVGAFSKLATAQERYNSSMAKFKAASGGKEMERAYTAARTAAKSLIDEHLRGAAKMAGAFTLVAVAVGRMTDSYTRFVTSVSNLSQLTGSNMQTSARALVLGRVAGLDTSAVRDLAKPSRAIFSDSGRSALARLGISPNPNASGLEVFDQVAKRLSTMQDGLRKTQIMAQIFGEKGAESMLPLLRMSESQRRAVAELADTYDTGASKAVQEFTFASAMLGETMLQRVIYPIVQQLLPILQRGIELVTWMANVWGNLNDVLGGVPNWAVAMLGFGAAIASIVFIVQKLAAAFAVARSAAIALGVAQAVAQFMAGDITALGRIAVGAAIVGAGAYGLNAAFNAASGSSKKQESAADKLDRAADKFVEGVNRMGDSLGDLKGKSIPRGLDHFGIGRLAQQMNLGAVG